MSAGTDEQTRGTPQGPAERLPMTPEGRPEGISTQVVLLLIFLCLMAYGLYLGNVFETYHNGSNL